MIRPPPAPGRPRPAKREAGFTLIEVVCAFVILALVLTTSYQIFSTGLQRAGDLEDYSRALVIAQSQLEQASFGETFEDSQTGGESEDRRFRWAVSVSRYDDASASQPATTPQPMGQAFVPVRIAVRVTWRTAADREKNLDLATLVVARAT
jgi:general secretion pathway protein I